MHYIFAHPGVLFQKCGPGKNFVQRCGLLKKWSCPVQKYYIIPVRKISSNFTKKNHYYRAKLVWRAERPRVPPTYWWIARRGSTEGNSFNTDRCFNLVKLFADHHWWRGNCWDVSWCELFGAVVNCGSICLHLRHKCWWSWCHYVEGVHWEIQATEVKGNIWLLSVVAIGHRWLIWLWFDGDNLWLRWCHLWNHSYLSCQGSRQMRLIENVRVVIPGWALLPRRPLDVKIIWVYW